MKCNHEHLTQIKEVNGRMLWMCSCGRKPTTILGMDVERLRDLMHAIDFVYATTQNTAATDANSNAPKH
jgi:hypothetical protein